jgi:hypothetical protein
MVFIIKLVRQTVTVWVQNFSQEMWKIWWVAMKLGEIAAMASVEGGTRQVRIYYTILYLVLYYNIICLHIYIIYIRVCVYVSYIIYICVCTVSAHGLFFVGQWSSQVWMIGDCWRGVGRHSSPSRISSLGDSWWHIRSGNERSGNWTYGKSPFYIGKIW